MPSDDESRSKAPPPAAPPNPSRRRKPDPTPQEVINRIWSKFCTPKFSQATTLLPRADKSPLSRTAVIVPSEPLGDNPLVTEDYERAVRECRVRVDKLVQECRRLNLRYRDPDFDIDL